MPRSRPHPPGHGLALPASTVAELRAILPAVAEDTVAAIIAEVPGYAGALSGRLGENIRDAVQLALGGFLSLASGRGGSDPRTPTAPAVEGAYQLGRGEARGGRTTEALLAAYRIGARVAWHEMSTTAVRSGLDAASLVPFAELVFAYIDELSAASVAGHNDELATSGRVRQQLLDRLVLHLLEGSPAETVLAAADRAGWTPPTTLTAVLAPESQVGPLLASLPGGTLAATGLAATGLADGEERAVLLVPDAHESGRPALLRTLAERDCVAGPARPWLEVRISYQRALRARALGLTGDTEAHLPGLVLHADTEALADLRAQVLAPLAGLRPAAAEKLTDTLRSWLLHQGRREDVAADLFVHAQTVRYRMGQLRELYGDRLEDPDLVLALTLALADRTPPREPA